MANLKKQALRKELWGMIPDDAKKHMQGIKQTYLNSLMADIESYANGKILDYLKENYSWCRNIESIEALDNKLMVTFLDGQTAIFNSFVDIMHLTKLPF